MKISASKYFKILLVIVIGSILIGCWDYQELENRGIITGISIDKAFPLPQGQEDTKEYQNERDMEKSELQKGNPKYSFTIQAPIMSQAKNKPSGMSGGVGGEEPSWELTMQGNSFFAANRQFATRLEYPPFYEHLLVIVISEDVARQGIIEPLDMILRDPEMRRKTKVFIAPGEAKTIINVIPRLEDYSGAYLANLTDNAEKTSRMLHVTDLGEVSESLHSNIDFVLPRVTATEDEIKDAGCAVFRGDKMVGWLGEVDTIYLKWVRDAVLGGVVVIKPPNNLDGLITLELRKVKTKVRPSTEDGNIKMTIRSSVTANIAEESMAKFEDSLNDDFIKEVENIAKKQIEDQIIDTAKYVQKKYNADIFHFNVNVKRYQPNLWKEIEDRWYDIFPKLKVESTVDVKIRAIGIIK